MVVEGYIAVEVPNLPQCPCVHRGRCVLGLDVTLLQCVGRGARWAVCDGRAMGFCLWGVLLDLSRDLLLRKTAAAYSGACLAGAVVGLRTVEAHCGMGEV